MVTTPYRTETELSFVPINSAVYLRWKARTASKRRRGRWCFSAHVHQLRPHCYALRFVKEVVPPPILTCMLYPIVFVRSKDLGYTKRDNLSSFLDLLERSPSLLTIGRRADVRFSRSLNEPRSVLSFVSKAVSTCWHGNVWSKSWKLALGSACVCSYHCRSW